MARTVQLSVVLILLGAMIFAVSCAKKEEQQETHPGGERAIQYIAEDVSFGIFFDPEGTKRTLSLGPDEREFDIHIFVHFPEYLEINAVEFRLELPEGVVITNDKYYQERTLSMGHLDHGISEAFTCITGPKLLLHTLTLRSSVELENAVFSILPNEKSQQAAVTKCAEGYPVIKASSYRAVVNPVE